uniref:Uncharacterized protein LOC111122796 n=1 Tax=Crassostrea virginica TaxID=6565 RepID=A0A8B8CXU1_CRAVI|nr:uncharacterized protein LOC111122796 [Crassostrea virginica]
MSSSKADKKSVVTTLPKEAEEYLIGLENENKQLKDEKKYLLSRLSQVAGVLMTEDNPNITDLSDVNRPINLGEDLSQIYDDEYTDIFVQLKERECERDIHNDMLSIAERCFRFCDSQEKEQFEKILNVFQFNDVANRQSLPRGVIKHVKELRTLSLKNTEANLEKKFIGHLISETKQSLLKYDEEIVKKYISKCISFFWKACIQTPPLKFDFNVPPGTPFDSAVHRKCTVNGPNVAYTVWPVVYLHENGPVLVKGVVQCDGKLTDSKKEGTKPSNTKL